MSEALRWGVIGSGSIASSFATDLALTDSGRMVAVGSRRQETADRFADRYGIPNRHGSYRALVEDPEVEVVYVATPHPMHLAHAQLALEHGKPALVEKAFAMSAAEARTMVRSARSEGLFLMEAMWTRFLPHMVEIRRLLDEGALGDIELPHQGRGLRHEADEVARCIRSGLLESPIMPLDESVAIMETMDAVLAQSSDRSHQSGTSGPI